MDARDNTRVQLDLPSVGPSVNSPVERTIHLHARNDKHKGTHAALTTTRNDVRHTVPAEGQEMGRVSDPTWLISKDGLPKEAPRSEEGSGGGAERQGCERGRRRKARPRAGEAPKSRDGSGGGTKEKGGERGRRREARRGAGEAQKSKAGGGRGAEKHDREQREVATGQERVGGRLRASSIITRATARDRRPQSHFCAPVFGCVQASLAAGEKIDFKSIIGCD